MKISIKVILAAILAILFLLSFSFIYLVYDPFSNCPIAFRFEFETHCWVKDERNGTKLIELFNIEDNGLWLAKVSSMEVIWLEHPSKHLDSYKDHVPENIIKFSNNELNMLLVNGEKFPVTVLPSRPKP